MYAILTEDINLIKLAESKNEKVVDLNTSSSLYLSILNSEKSNERFKAQEKNIEKELFKLLINLGIPSNIKGFRYISYAIIALLKDEKYETLGITKGLYPAVAKHFNTTPLRVERSIRTAIEHAFEKGSAKLMHDIFGKSLDADKGKATNSEFIIGIKNYLTIIKNF